MRATLDMRTGAVCPAVMPELMPSLVLENDRPEWKVLLGEYTWMHSGYQAAVAGQYSHVGIVCEHQNTLLVVEEIHILNATDGSSKICMASKAGFTPTGLSQPREARMPLGVAAAGQVYVLASVASTAAGLYVQTPTNTSVVVRGPWVQYGGSPWVLFVQTHNVNSALTASFLYRARRMEPSEAV